ncbi:DUF3793 family protein [Pelotomaculum propionicicum]|uniref:DUF3793 family protein n=1 Tax=Pelotomaculum propionicicum TaxID=258475 RepID=UPI003B820F72
MDASLKLKYLECLNRMQGKDYLAAIISFGAAPTIKGRKPSSLIAFSGRRKNLFALWHCYKQEICLEFNLEYCELKDGAEIAIVLFYRRKMLERYLGNSRNLDFLNSLGYQEAVTLDEKLQLLKSRFALTCTHEVGIFLGFPVEDVKGFIENKGKNYLLSRYWKVYRNRERAELLFRIYDEATLDAASAVIRYSEGYNSMRD